MEEDHHGSRPRAAMPVAHQAGDTAGQATPGADKPGASGAPAIDTEEQRLTTAKAWRRANDVPGKAFGDPTLFVNPALNILLDLYISAREEQPVNVSSACVASGAPATTALRYIARLSQLGFVRKVEDTRDHRVCYLSLTAEGMAHMTGALDLAVESDRRLGIGRLSVLK